MAEDATDTGCCEVHTDPCCDPLDCGPCCPDCPTCPSLHPEWFAWLNQAERREFAQTAATYSHAEDDPRYWTGSYLTADGAYGCRDHAARLRNQMRWAWLAAVFDRDRHGDLPMDTYRRQTQWRQIHRDK